LINNIEHQAKVCLQVGYLELTW